MNGLAVAGWNWISVILVLILAVSMLQGARRGASGSAKQLFGLVTEGAATVVALYLAWKSTGAIAPRLQTWLMGLEIVIPERELSLPAQMYYTFVTSLRDFALLRGAVVFIVLYGLLKGLMNRFLIPLLDQAAARMIQASSPVTMQQAAGASYSRSRSTRYSGRTASWLSAPAGGLIGGITGTGRALTVIAALLVYGSLFPNSPLSTYAAKSVLYQKGATQVIAPFTGQMLAQLPVFTQSVADEFNQILRRKYEVLDARIPDDVAAAAQEVVSGKTTDEAKARALYQWVGTRIKYDWEKVRLYEEERIWKEQTPEDTFATRTGVCIDYSRLYAVMARSAGLAVKVVTGLGSDGRGGMGSHAWNEVYLAEKQAWVPLDSTWVASGGNWFNPEGFYETHIKEV